VGVGYNDYGQLDVGSWTGIVQVAVGYKHTVGLKSDGTAVAVGDNTYGQLDVGSWTDIVQVATDMLHTVGLKSNGTVVALGWDVCGMLDVGSWTDIVQVAAGGLHTVGLKSNGTVVAVGYDYYGQVLDVGSWTGIVQVAAGYTHTVGLKSDGTVVAVGDNTYGKCNTADWDLSATVQDILNQTTTLINDLAPGAFKNSNMRQDLTYKINAVLNLIEQGLYMEALNKLEHDILKKTDGCANKGVPDNNDWITNCPAQSEIYPFIIEAIGLLMD